VIRFRRLIPGLCAIVCLVISASPVPGEVYVNMLWDEQTQGFKVKTLSVPDGVTFDRGYQNAYGVANDLPEGPPFYIQASIQGAGSITFESGSPDPFNPFVIYVQIGEGYSGLISGGDGVNFIGNSLDPIRIEGPFKIQSGVDYQYHGLQWTNTDFRCTFSDITSNHNPFSITGGSATIESCSFPDYSPPFSSLISMLDFGTGKSCVVTIRNCRFERLSFPNQTYPIIVRDAAEFTLEDCHFEEVEYWEDDISALIDIRRCGIKSIKGNTASRNSQSKLYLIEARVEDSAFIRCSDELPIISSTIEVDPGGALALGQGSVIKFLGTGGLDVGGRLYVDSAVFTSWEDDAHGGDTDNKPQPDPFVGNWSINGACGILIDSTGTAEMTKTLIRYPRGGMYAFNQVTLDDCYFENGWYSGLVLRGAYAADFTISNTTIRGFTRVDPYSAAIFYENRTLLSQTLTLDNVSLLSNEMDGIDVFYMSGGPTRIDLNNCRIADNLGHGIVFPINNALESLDITNSLFVGNAYTAIDGKDNYGSGIPIKIENNVVVGNGLHEYAARKDGIHLAGGTCRIVGNTVLHNGRMGILVEGLDTIAQCVVANNLLAGNAEYGLYKSDYGAPIVVGNNHWDNGDEAEELRYRGPDGWVFTVEDLQALGGDLVTNVHIAPGLLPEITGPIDTIFYDSHTGLSRLVDASAGFPPPQMLAGRYVCPDTADPRWYLLWNVAGDTLMLLGDISEHADTGSTYRIVDYHLLSTSALIDAGVTTQTQEMFDIDGNARILDGDENGSMLVDIGADEFNGEAEPDPIRVLQPTGDKLVVSYQSFNIEFQAADSIDLVDIYYSTSYDPVYPDDNWETIAVGTDASSGYYAWPVPANETSTACRIRISGSAHPDIRALSQPFKIKHYGLTRLSADNYFVTYGHPDDSWQFPNDSANMWPVEAWPSYIFDNDPVTGLPYPLEFAGRGVDADSSDFPSWPTFVEAFGVDACYFNTWNGYLYRPAAVLRWGSIKRKWNGSCVGLAVTSLMAFVDSAAFAGRDEIGAFANLHSLTMTDNRRNLISRYFTYQFGKANLDHTMAARTKTPSETLAELRSMFTSLEASDADRVVTICDTTSVNGRGCHSVMPYMLDRTSQENNTWSLLVYDSNVPNDYPTIDIDADADSWTYAQLGLSGDRLFFLEDPLSNYADVAIMTTPPRDRPPVASADGYMEIYLNAGDSVRLASAAGAIGQYGDSSYNELSDAMPIIPRAGGPGHPIGYVVPEGDWSCRLTGVDDEVVHLTAFTDSMVMTYRRVVAGPTETEQVDIRDNGLQLFNPGSARTCDVDIVRVHADRERLLALDSLYLADGDSTAVEMTPTEGLRVVNYGAESSYRVLLQDISDAGLSEFEHENLVLEANSAHQLEPDWSHPADSLMIVIDRDLDGEYEDTIFVSNDSPTDVDDPRGSDLPYRFELAQNYPNPFNPATRIEYSLPRRSHVTIAVYNVLGQLVLTLVDREEPAGWHETSWRGVAANGESVASGVYLYRFQAGDYVETRKMLFLK